MPSDTTSRPDLMWMVAFHSALRRDLAHLARTTSRTAATTRPGAERSDRLGAVQDPAAQSTPARTPTCGRGCAPTCPGRPTTWRCCRRWRTSTAASTRWSDSVDGALADPDHGHERLADTVDALTAELSGHLAHEERDTLPLLERSLSQAEWQGFVTDQRRKSGIRGAAQFLPWPLDGTSAERRSGPGGAARAAAVKSVPPDLAARLRPPRPLGAINTGMKYRPARPRAERIFGGAGGGLRRPAGRARAARGLDHRKTLVARANLASARAADSYRQPPQRLLPAMTGP